MQSRSDVLVMYSESMSGVLSQSDVGPEVRKDETHYYYRCPCGVSGHHASRAIDRHGDHPVLSEVLHCWESGQQWTVKPDVCSTILAEEVAFSELLDRFESEGLVGKRVTAAEAFRLRTERGVPADMLDIDDIDEFDRLWADHQEVSRAGKSSR